MINANNILTNVRLEKLTEVLSDAYVRATTQYDADVAQVLIVIYIDTDGPGYHMTLTRSADNIEYPELWAPHYTIAIIPCIPVNDGRKLNHMFYYEVKNWALGTLVAFMKEHKLDI